MRQVWQHQLLFLACYFFWMSSVQAESSISGDKGGNTTIGDASANNNVTLNNSAFAIANYRTLESLEPPLFRDGFESNVTFPDPVTITSFSASPSTINEGQSTTLSWTTQNATSCAPSGGTGGWDARSITLPSGSENITIATAGTYTFTVTCQDSSGGSAISNIAVTANVDPIPRNCPPPSLSGSVFEWATFWNNVPFPGPIFADEFTIIPRNGYIAIKFNTGNFSDTGLLTTIESTATSGRRLGAISQCPGDFDVTDKCRHIWGVGGEIFWSTQGYSKACILEPNTTYYFSVTFTDGVDPASSECVNANCITKIRAKNP